jgi:hypothetical protein
VVAAASFSGEPIDAESLPVAAARTTNAERLNGL